MIAYVDTSCMLALAFGEAGSRALEKRLDLFDNLYSSSLIESELLSALSREGRALEALILNPIQVMFPVRSLQSEIQQVLRVGYVRGADCHHLATALWMAEDRRDLTFLTLDLKQRKVAQALGFKV